MFIVPGIVIMIATSFVTQRRALTTRLNTVDVTLALQNQALAEMLKVFRPDNGPSLEVQLHDLVRQGDVTRVAVTKLTSAVEKIVPRSEEP